jgi:DNA-binding MurR/RpiR family transcriptional regulator
MTNNESEFEPMDFDELKAALDRHHHPNCSTAVGERLAAMVLSKTKEQLDQIITDAENAAMDELVDTLLNAEEVMRVRHGLLTMALARICVVADLTSKAA